MRAGIYILASCLLAGSALIAQPVVAQNTQDSFEVGFQARETQRRALISSAMGFDEAEAEKFWPIYDVYRIKEKSLQLRRLKLLRRVSEIGVGMNTESADEIVVKALKLDTDMAGAKNDYFEEIRKSFDGVKYFRLYQLETKLNAIFQAGWTSKIPLSVSEEEAEVLREKFYDAQQAKELSATTT